MSKVRQRSPSSSPAVTLSPNPASTLSSPANSNDKQVPLTLDDASGKVVLRNAVIIFVLACITFGSIYIFFAMIPHVESDACTDVTIKSFFSAAWNFDVNEIRQFWSCLEAYKQDNYYAVLIGFILVYVSMNSFAIPGPIILSLLAGALFGWRLLAYLISHFYYLSGASFAYLISHFLGKPLLWKLCPEMLKSFSTRVDNNRDDMFWYMLFLRISPILPNWFINVSCPIVNVPWYIFASGTFIGLIPNNYIFNTMGLTIANATSLSKSWEAPLYLMGLGFLTLLPTLFKKKILEAQEKRSQENGKKKSQKKQ